MPIKVPFIDAALVLSGLGVIVSALVYAGAL